MHCPVKCIGRGMIQNGSVSAAMTGGLQRITQELTFHYLKII
jgi:hypothetical protein